MYNFLGLKNCPILSKDDLCIIGLVKDCFSVENNCQIAYFLCINNDQDFLVPFDNFTAINDALILDNCIEIRHVHDVDFTTLKSLMDKDVYLDNGQYVGKTTDLSFDHNGKILQVFAEDNTFKPSDILGIGEIVLLKGQTKKRKKSKGVNLTALATEDKPVSIIANDTLNKAPTQDKHQPVESTMTNPVVPQSSMQVLVATPAPVPPRVISDYNFLLGRMLTADLYTFEGVLIGNTGTLITTSMVDKARLNGKLLELTHNSK